MAFLQASSAAVPCGGQREWNPKSWARICRRNPGDGTSGFFLLAHHSWRSGVRNPKIGQNNWNGTNFLASVQSEFWSRWRVGLQNKTMESTVSILQSLTLLSGPVCRHKSCSLSPLPFQGPIVVININADNLELEENDDGSKIVNIKAGNDDQQILEEEEFIPDYEDYDDYDEDDDIGVVSLRWGCKDMVASFTFVFHQSWRDTDPDEHDGRTNWCLRNKTRTTNFHNMSSRYSLRCAVEVDLFQQ